MSTENVENRYDRAEGTKKIILHSKFHRARGGEGGSSSAAFWRKKNSYVNIGRSLNDLTTSLN